MTPSVFETDTWPKAPVGCFNSLTLQCIGMILDMEVRLCKVLIEYIIQVSRYA